MTSCKNCSVKINKGEIYCEKCYNENLINATSRYMQAIMRGDLLTANKIKVDNPNLDVSSMMVSDLNKGFLRYCPKCIIHSFPIYLYIPLSLTINLIN